jgi:hypothetical protein
MGRFALNVDKRVERICRAISKQVQRSDAGIEVDVMHTGNESRYRALDKGLYDKRMVLRCRALDKGLHDKRGEERSTGTRQVCKPRTECSKITKLKTTSYTSKPYKQSKHKVRTQNKCET